MKTLERKVDTARAAAEFGRRAGTTAEDAAEAIVRGILHDKPRLLIGPDAYAIDAMARLLPVSYGGIVRRAARSRAR